MSVDFTLLRELYAPGIERHKFMATNPPDFKSWVMDGYFDIDVKGKREAELYIRDYRCFSSMLSHDSSRMAAASFESLQSVQYLQFSPRSLAWASVQIYYSAFFAAHGIMRIFGDVCSYLERGHVQQLNEYFKLFGDGAELTEDAGYFHGKHDSERNLLCLRKVAKPHEDTWKAFAALLESLGQDVLRVNGLSMRKQELSDYLSSIKNDMGQQGRFGNYSWLSHMRNSINYRHEHGVWFPYRNSSESVARIRRIVDLWGARDVRDFSAITMYSDIELFFELCLKVINLNYSLVEDVCMSENKKSGCFNSLPRGFLNLVA